MKRENLFYLLVPCGTTKIRRSRVDMGFSPPPQCLCLCALWADAGKFSRCPQLLKQIQGPAWYSSQTFFYNNYHLEDGKLFGVSHPRYVCVCSVVSDSLWLHVTVACQAPLPMGFLRWRILEWMAISFSRGSFWSRGQTRITCVSCTGRWMIYFPTWEALQDKVF